MVLGLIVLWGAGLVSFGQTLYYAIGAYCVALLSRFAGITDAFRILGRRPPSGCGRTGRVPT